MTMSKLKRIEGIKRLKISQESQQFINCKTGHDVSFEHTWKLLPKQIIQDHITMFKDQSDFFSIREEILKSTSKNVLLIYIFDETKDIDEFYLCLAEHSIKTALPILERKNEQMKHQLNSFIFKLPHPWTNKGSDMEVNDHIVPESDHHLTEIVTKYPIILTKSAKVRLSLRRAQTLVNGYVEFKSEEERPLYKKRIDNILQVSPEVRSSFAQTDLTYPKQQFTQYKYQYDGLRQEEQEEILKKINSSEISACLNSNAQINLYTNDFKINGGYEDKAKPEDYFSSKAFVSPNYCNDKMVSCLAWNPKYEHLIVVAYCEQALKLNISSESTSDLVCSTFEKNPVLVWDINDALQPKAFLETLRSVTSLVFHEFNEGSILAGCQNGQLVLWELTKIRKYIELNSETHLHYFEDFLNWSLKENINLIPASLVSGRTDSHTGSITQMSCDLITDDDSNFLQVITCAEDGLVLFWKLQLTNEESDSRSLNLSILRNILIKEGTTLVPISSMCYDGDRFFLGTISGKCISFEIVKNINEEDEIKENIDFVRYNFVHNGPVTSCTLSMDKNIILTVGLNIIALWSFDLKTEPLLWRESDNNLILAEWLPSNIYQFITLGYNGSVKKWDVFNLNKAPIKETSLANNSITSLTLNKDSTFNELCIGDSEGNVRQISSNIFNDQQAFTYKQGFLKLIDLKLNFLENYNTMLNTTKVKKEEPKSSLLKQKSQKVLVATKAECKKRASVVLKLKTQKETVNKMQKFVVKKKQLDIDSLLKERKPLLEMRQREKELKLKHRLVFQNSESHFDQTVSTLFPEIGKTMDVQTTSLKSGVEDLAKLESVFQQYKDLETLSKDFIKDHPYEHTFDWKSFIRLRRHPLEAICKE